MEEKYIQQILDRLAKHTIVIRKIAFVGTLFAIYMQMFIPSIAFLFLLMCLDAQFLCWDRKIRESSNLELNFPKKSLLYLRCLFSSSIVLFYLALLVFIVLSKSNYGVTIYNILS